MNRLILPFAAFLVLAGCENVDRSMHDQIYSKIEKVKNIQPPQGSVPALGTKVKIDWSQIDPKTVQPLFPLDGSAAQKGEKLFGIYCSPCHGMTGNADTKVAAKMDLTPPPLTSDRAKNELKDTDIFLKILANEGLMPRYRAELEDAEAWQVVAYVRQLQKTTK